MNRKKFPHWVLQILPPLLILFLISDNGLILAYLGGVSAIFAFISIISIIFKLFKFKAKKYYLLRPVLSCLVLVILFIMSSASYESAKKLAVSEARQINIVCNKLGKCPTKLTGWEGPRTKFGEWIKYPAWYKNDGKEFEIYLVRFMEDGDHISGGVDKALKIVHESD